VVTLGRAAGRQRAVPRRRGPEQGAERLKLRRNARASMSKGPSRSDPAAARAVDALPRRLLRRFRRVESATYRVPRQQSCGLPRHTVCDARSCCYSAELPTHIQFGASMRRPIHLTVAAIVYGFFALVEALFFFVVAIAAGSYGASVVLVAGFAVPMFLYALAGHWLWRLDRRARWACSAVAVGHIVAVLWSLPTAWKIVDHYAFPVEGQYVILSQSRTIEMLADLLAAPMLQAGAAVLAAVIAFRWFGRHPAPTSS
jgi:hypothetical protein